MDIMTCKKFADILAQRRPDFPQVIVAGWMMPNGKPVASVVVNTEVIPKSGQMVVSLASCLAACLQKVDEVCASNPAQREQLMNLVMMMVGELHVVKRFKNDLFAADAAKGSGE